MEFQIFYQINPKFQKNKIILKSIGINQYAYISTQSIVQIFKSFPQDYVNNIYYFKKIIKI